VELLSSAHRTAATSALYGSADSPPPLNELKGFSPFPEPQLMFSNPGTHRHDRQIHTAFAHSGACRVSCRTALQKYSGRSSIGAKRADSRPSKLSGKSAGDDEQLLAR
jgi:hypothetical protein